MSNILTQRGREPDIDIWICRATQFYIIPPFWFGIIAITATVYDPVTQVRQITYRLTAANPAVPPVSMWDVSTPNDGGAGGTLRNDGTPLNFTFNQSITEPVIVIVLSTVLGKAVTQYDQPPKHAF